MDARDHISLMDSMKTGVTVSDNDHITTIDTLYDRLVGFDPKDKEHQRNLIVRDLE